MSNGGFIHGWKVVRARRSEFRDPGQVRRRTVVCGLVAVGVGVFLVIADRFWGLFDGSLLQQAVAVVLFSAAVGCFGAAFLRVTGRSVSASPGRQLGDWRRSERIDRQFAARPPAMLAEDRDEVIARAERSVGLSVVAATRFVWIPVGWVLAWVALLVSGFATADQLTLLVIPPVFALLQSAAFVAAVTAAGRADAARSRALRLPATALLESPPQHNRDPRGSKLELPND
ncbi:hypothetical protein DEJ28_06255 [Curtobacterium sp. MCPF17_002]|uniref:hypothetical protein n=1 Tax=Curtobacterium sp. MCPF17_002 TaxID=2175645 RepID=UPI0011B7C08E|nr:hypothetical protein [Curtobacterium sp. MCPF17_002]WIB78696.1 hypothetical protein DEJ28_06255 [Curtobacterium sp. MCPF17_002]